MNISSFNDTHSALSSLGPRDASLIGTHLINSEFRFPILWRISGITGFYAGNVWPSLLKMSLENWQ